MAGLSKWITQIHGSAHVVLKPSKIPGRGGGYGMVAEQDIKKGEKLVSVPSAAWMTSKTARKSSKCKHIIEEHSFDAWKALSLHLLCERRRGGDSFWHPYIELLPSQDYHPLSWTDKQLGWLKGSPMADKLKKRQGQVVEDMESLKSAGANSIDWTGSDADSDLVTVKSMRWAAATLLSRAFNLQIPTPGPTEVKDTDVFPDDITTLEEKLAWLDADVEDERVLALVPWADLLNHSSAASERSILQYDETNDAATCFAHKDYAEGDEVFDSYGRNLTPSELLLDYGFVDTKNKICAVTVPAVSMVDGAAEGLNQHLIASINSTFEGSPEMCVTDTGIDDTLLSYVRSAVAPASHLKQFGWDGSWKEGDNADAPLDTMARLVDPIDFNTEAKVLETLMAWCDRQLQGYANAVQNDREELEDPKTQWVRTQVLRALIAEKQAVLGIQRELRDKMQQLKEGCPLDTLYD